jgi:beta-barrel assembly-enhancing protease
MMQQLDANYYSGIKPIAHKVTVILYPDHFRIESKETEHVFQKQWQLSQIRPDQDNQDGKLILSYGKPAPNEFLEFTEPEALLILNKTYPGKHWISSKNMLQKYPMGIMIAGVLAFFVLVFFSYKLLVPGISDAVSKGVPVEWEVELGSKMAQSVIAYNKEDTVRSKMLDSFFLIMDVHSKYPIKLHFINDSVVNAFAMPGGNIVIYKGLFDKMNSYESLAGLIGHEFTHVEFKHSLKSIFRSVSSFIILAAFFGDLTGLAGILLENANTIQNLSYSRQFEREADENAVQILLDRKIGLSGMLDLFSVFLDEGKKGMEVPKFFSTHPVTQDRIDYVKSQMSTRESDLVHYANLSDLFTRMKQSQ